MIDILMGIGCFVLGVLVISVLLMGAGVCGFMATRETLETLAEMEDKE